MSGGVLAALAGYFLIVQAFVAAFACGMTVDVQAGPRFVLCQPSTSVSGIVQDAAPDRGDPSGFSHDCPCVICHATDFDLALTVAPGADLGRAYAVADAPPVHPLRLFGVPVDPSRLGLAPAARGPPAVSA